LSHDVAITKRINFKDFHRVFQLVVIMNNPTEYGIKITEAY